MNHTGKATLAIIGFMAFVVTAAATPQLTIPQERYDFGFVPRNAKVSHVFWLRSTGTDTVRIANVVPGCGCTRTPLEKNILAPGDSTQLEVIFDTRSFSGMVTKRPTIQFSDGSPDQHVSFVCSVAPRPDSTYPIIINPYELDLSQVGDKTRTEMKFAVTNVGDTELTLSVDEIPAELFQLELPKTIKAGKKAEGTLRLTKAAHDKEFEKAITIELSDQRHSRFTIPVKRSIRKQGEAVLTPSNQTEPWGH